MPTATRGTLVECDASIKAIIMNLNSANRNKYVIQELDDEHVLVSNEALPELKARLKEMLAETQYAGEEAERGMSDDDL